MPMLPITAFYAVLLAILLLVLASSVVKARRKHLQGLGHVHKEVLLTGRNHANASEYIPILVILLALAELNGANFLFLHGLGLTILVGRLIHAWGFMHSQGKHHPGRFWGTTITWLAILIGCILNLMLVWPYLLRP